MKSWYDPEEDTLNLTLAEKEYWKSVELPDGTILSLEIPNASKVFSGEARKVIERASH